MYITFFEGTTLQMNIYFQPGKLNTHVGQRITNGKQCEQIIYIHWYNERNMLFILGVIIIVYNKIYKKNVKLCYAIFKKLRKLKLGTCGFKIFI